MARKAADVYEPDTLELVRESDQALEKKLTGKAAVEALAKALNDAAFEFTEDDLVTLSTAESLEITDGDDYTRGFDLLREVALIEERIESHYARFDKPLNFLVKVNRGNKGPQLKTVEPVKQGLSRRLGTWKHEKDREDAERKRKEQEAADAAAKAAQDAKAKALRELSKVEPDPALARSFAAEAETVSTVTVHAAPVETESSVPIVPGGWTKVTWKAEITDLKELMRAWVDGRISVIDEDGIKEGLQSFLDGQARALENKLHLAFPGTKAIPQYGAVTRRK